jgi:hypothetical protein
MHSMHMRMRMHMPMHTHMLQFGKGLLTAPSVANAAGEASWWHSEKVRGRYEATRRSGGSHHILKV